MHIVRAAPSADRSTAIAASGFVQPATDQLRDDVSDHLARGHLVYSFQDGGHEVGFAIFNVWGEVLYLSGIILMQAHQRRENLQAVMQLARQDAPDTCYLALRTQSLRMWAAASRLCQPWFPQAHAGLDLPRDYALAGQLVAAQIGGIFPVQTGCYKGPLYGDRPVHHNEALQLWWDGLCRYEGGDAVICVGRLIG